MHPQLPSVSCQQQPYWSSCSNEAGRLDAGRIWLVNRCPCFCSSFSFPDRSCQSGWGTERGVNNGPAADPTTRTAQVNNDLVVIVTIIDRMDEHDSICHGGRAIQLFYCLCIVCIYSYYPAFGLYMFPSPPPHQFFSASYTPEECEDVDLQPPPCILLYENARKNYVRWNLRTMCFKT